MPIRSRRWLLYGSDQANSWSSSAVVCALCNLIHKHESGTHVANTQAREVVAKFDLAPDATMCRPCQDDIHWVTTNPTHSPTSEKQTHLGLWKDAKVHNQIPCIPAMQKKQMRCYGYMQRGHTATGY